MQHNLMNDSRLFVRTLGLAYLVCCLAAFTLPNRNGLVQEEIQSRETAQATTNKADDACALLTSAEIEMVQGEPISAIQLHTLPGNGMSISQCIFRTHTPSKSVSVLLAHPDPSQSGTLPRKLWEQQFHSAQPREKLKKGEIDQPFESEEASKSRPVKGIGQEAYWVGDSRVGAIYVLQSNSFFRISIGGIADEAARAEKSNQLARFAVNRVQFQSKRPAIGTPVPRP